MELYPSWATVLDVEMPTHGTYPKEYPYGAVVHFTAGRGTAPDCIKYGKKMGYAYWCIDRAGKLFCAHPVNRYGWHAGKSYLKGLIGSVSDDLIGIETICAGKVEPIKGKPGKFKTWFGTELDETECRYTPGKDNQQKGWYHKFTIEQEETLIKTILWLKEQNPDVFDFEQVVGHDEVSPLRKNDPGSALVYTMPEFREILKEEYKHYRGGNQC